MAGAHLGDLRVTALISIPAAELEERFARSPGPGGQNVNKVATAVQLRFDVARSGVLPEDVRARLRRLAGRRLSTRGVLSIQAHRRRSLEQNRRDARERLAALIRRAAEPPRPRKATRPSRAQRERRLDAKRQRAQAKRRRAPVDRDHE